MSSKHLTRIADALDRLAPSNELPHLPKGASAYLWQGNHFLPVKSVAHVPLKLLKGVEQQQKILWENTQRFSDGKPANHALLWGARGMGKSSLIKAIHQELKNKLILIEILREDIRSLPRLLQILSQSPKSSKWFANKEPRFLLFSDDLSFSHDDETYKALKSVLDGGIQGTPDNILFYATSNRRHLMPRDMMENEQKTAIHGDESAEEKISLSDRFGLWLGFHKCSQDTYLEMIESYTQHFNLFYDDELKASALEWAITRGNRSGRTAWQFIQSKREH